MQAAALVLMQLDLKMKVPRDVKAEGERLAGLASAVALRIVYLNMLAQHMADYVSEEMGKLEDKEEMTDAEQERFDALENVTGMFEIGAKDPLGEAVEIIDAALAKRDEEVERPAKRAKADPEANDSQEESSSEEEDDDYLGEDLEGCGFGDDF